MQIFEVPAEHVGRVVDILHEAFYEYPVMRYVLGRDARDFDRQHALLIRLFVMGRVLSHEPLFGIGDTGHLSAAAIVSLPETQGVSTELAAYREATWAKFEPGARKRYDAFCSACGEFDISEPHHHLNMIGVRHAHQGQGLGRRLVEHVIGLSDAHANSAGVSLSTEFAENVPFYEHLGFEMTGHARVGPGLETWNFFRRG